MVKRLEREFEKVRREMEEAATRLGINHPEVHRLSRRLDRLHNQILWEKKALMEEPRSNKDPLYRIRRYSCYLKETSEMAEKPSLPQDSSVVNIRLFPIGILLYT